MKNKKGFTLVELLAVIAILAILVILALPNVINLYNKAQKETFLTEVKKIHSEAEKKYISSSINGNTIKTINSEDDSKLDMTGEKLQYCINLNNSGKVTSMKVSNHKWIASLEDGKSIEDLTIDDLEDGNLDGYKCTGTSSVPAVYCTYDGELKQGAEYVNGQYTYRYMQEMNENPDTTSEDDIFIWKNMSQDGWGVVLTDKSSTESVATKLCTYINDKPIVSMSAMFALSKGTALDLSSFNTSNVTNMSNMFAATEAKNIIGLNKFSTGKVTNMSTMFGGVKTTTLDLSSFNTSNVTNMELMFAHTQVSTLNLSGFDTSKITDMNQMFLGFEAGEIKGLNSFNTSNVTRMDGMFQSIKVKSLDLSSFDTSKVTDMGGMFARSNIENLDLSSFNTSNVTSMSNMFSESQLTSINLSSFNTLNVTHMSKMFDNSQVTILDLSSFDTSNVLYMADIFKECTNLKTIYVSDKFVTTKLYGSTNHLNMFYGSTNLVGGNGTKYNSAHVNETYARIDTASTPGYFTLKNN